MGTLYVVATPIGNIEDLSPRAHRILREVDMIAAEDTRHSGKLLARLGIETPMISYHAFNERSRIEMLLERLTNGDVALVSDAGTPAISDPGSAIVRAAAEAGYPVIAIPGTSALTAAVSVSGFADGPAVFLGFLPRKKGDRTRLLARSFETGFAVFFFESPRRVVNTLRELAAVVPDRETTVFRELTKIYEESVRGSPSQLADRLGALDSVKGEIVIGVAGIGDELARHESEIDLLTDRLCSGMSVSQAAKEVAALTGIPRSELYDRALQVRNSAKSV
ncbi:16S rRNA (cytidine(1402)-2'-O)-methyltransferase [soil metagenome]